MKFSKYILNKKLYSLAVCGQKARELREQGRDIISLYVGDPTEDTFSGTRSAAINYLQDNTRVGYPASRGQPELLEAVSDWANRNYQLSLNPKTQILSCNGTKEAVFHIPLVFDWSDSGEIFFGSIAYPVYKASAEAFGIKFRELPLTKENNFLPDLDSLSESDLNSCKIFWINSPHNPTTAVASKDYLTRLLKLAEKYDFLVCSDECYLEISYGQRPASMLEFFNSKHWMVFRSLSKRSRMTGYRSGAIITLNEELLAAFAFVRTPAGLGSPIFVQKAAACAWADDEHPDVFRDEYLIKRNIMREALEKKGFEIFGGEASFYLWFSHPKMKNSSEIFEKFLEKDLVITPGNAFGEDGEGFARIVYCVDEAVCRKAADRIMELEI